MARLVQKNAAGPLLGAVVGGLLAGCPVQEPDVVGVTTAEETRDIVAPIVRAACDHVFSCCNADERAFTFGPAIDSSNACVLHVLGVIAGGGELPDPDASTMLFGNSLDLEGLAPLLAHGLADDALEIDGAALQACVDELGARQCNAPSSPGGRCTPPAPPVDKCSLQTLVVGLRGVGESCATYGGLECEAGLTCVGGAEGVCVEGLGEGDPCFGEGCQDGLVCGFGSGTCVVARALGEQCAYADPTNPLEGTETIACRAGLVCDPTLGICGPATCGWGADCDSDLDCPEGLTCGLYTCRRPAPVGTWCRDAHDCASLNCVEGDNGSTCEPRLAVGEPCTADEECDSDTCSPDGACVVPGAVGDACVRDDDCATGRCSNDACAELLQVGDSCDATEYPECGPGTRCDHPEDMSAGTCVALLEQGMPCTNPDDCYGACEAHFGEPRCTGAPPGHTICDGA